MEAEVMMAQIVEVEHMACREKGASRWMTFEEACERWPRLGKKARGAWVKMVGVLERTQTACPVSTWSVQAPLVRNGNPQLRVEPRRQGGVMGPGK